eukprot:6210815-Pleurochrysis_carterae.AAC.1
MAGKCDHRRATTAGFSPFWDEFEVPNSSSIEWLQPRPISTIGHRVPTPTALLCCAYQSVGSVLARCVEFKCRSDDFITYAICRHDELMIISEWWQAWAMAAHAWAMAAN